MDGSWTLMRDRGPGARRRGSALIITLWLTLSMVAVALIFGDGMRLEYLAAANQVAGLQAAEAIESGRRYVGFVLRDMTEPGEAPDGEALLADGATVGDGRFWLIGRDGNDETGRARVFGLVDEASKLNLNTASSGMLAALPNMTDELAAAIVDWRDGDDVVSDNGAEASSYLLRDPAMACKNAPFESVDELRFVMGMDLDTLLGEDANLNGVLDENENDGDETPPDDDRDGILDPGLLGLVTVVTRDSRVDGDGVERIDVLDDESADRLRETLTEVLGSARAGEVLAGAGRLSGLRSPLEFYARGGLSVEEAVKIDDRITSGSEDPVGLVNINTAPAPVLAALPGIGADNASAVIAWRQTRASDAEALGSVRWLIEAIGEAAALEAGPFVTTRSYQFSADIVAVGHGGRGFRRERLIFDCADLPGAEEGTNPRIVSRRDLSGLGWPLGDEIWEEATSMASAR